MSKQVSFRYLAAAITVSAISVFAQTSTRVTGTVLDSSKAAIPGATVNLQLSGSNAVAYTTNTTAAGSFTLVSVSPATYDLVISKNGFARLVVSGIKVDQDRTTDVPAVELGVSSTSQTVEVTAATESVNTSNAEVSTTIAKEQIQNLPSIDRSPLVFLQSQAGINDAAGTTTVNGMRSSYVNVTVDGINVQDNFIRTNDLDFLPNLLLLDQVAEVSITTSNSSTAAYGGAAQVAFVTPSGTNQVHGNLYFSNRNSDLRANSFFNNQSGVPVAFLNQNQFGGSIGGHIIRNKLFYYGNYEGFDLHQQATANTTVLTQSALNGIFTYTNTAGVVQKVNILQAAGLNIDPAVQAAILAKLPNPSAINNYRTGDSTPTLLRNTAGYSFNRRDDRTRKNITTKFDYILSPKNALTASYIYNTDHLDRPDEDTSFDVVPNVFNNDHANLLSTSWRYSPTGTLTNEVRFGFNLAPAIFATSGTEPSSFLTTPTFITNPVNQFLTQGRNTNTFNYADNANWIHGNHTVQFGFQGESVRIETFNAAGIIPTYTLGISPSSTLGLTAAQLQGISANDLANANSLLATLAGLVTSATQTYNVTSRTSGFVNNASQIRNLLYDNYAAYVQDGWKIRRNLTATIGVRWDYLTPVSEANGLALLPTIQNNNVIQSILNPNTQLGFAGGGTGRPFYNSDKHQFAPNIGLAWDPTGAGKWSLRAGYSINYVNDSLVAAVNNSIATNAGLTTTPTLVNLTSRVNQGLPTVPTPPFQVPISLATNYALNSGAALSIPSPNLTAPYVQQWNVGVQRLIKGTVLDVRYVGNHGTKEIRGIDYNQVLINQILPNFQLAQQNGLLSQAASGVYRPVYNPAIAGSQPLPFFNQLPSAGLLTNSTVISDIQTGQVGQLAALYQQNGLNGPFSFFQNPNLLGANVLTNYSNSDYNALQTDVTHRFAHGFQFQVNYVYSHLLSDAEGTGQTDFEPFLDNHNAKIERHRPEGYSLTHVFKANGVYELPFGSGKKFNPGNRIVRNVIGGWNIAGILTVQSGSPFSILSARGTLNRTARATNETADTSLNLSQLNQLFQVQVTGNGPVIVNPSAVGPDGRAVAPDGTTPFAGQVFFNPGAGQIGVLQRADLQGPWVSNLDAKVGKIVRIRERQSFELRMDASNVLNHTTWFVPDQNINSTTFGKITSQFFGNRIVQFSLYYRF